MANIRLAKVLAGLVAVSALTIGTAKQARAEEWRIATLAPKGSVWINILEQGAAEIETKTQGRIKIKYYAGGVQGDERDVVRKMRLGQLDGAALTSVGLSMISQSIRVLELPRMFKDRKEMYYVRAMMWPTFQRRFKKRGFRLGAPGDVGPIYFYSTKPVDNLDALRNSKVWMWGDDEIVRRMYKKLKINGKPMGVPNVLPALSTGKINAFYGSPVAAVSLQWYSKANYVTSMPMSYAIGASVILEKVFLKATPEDQKLQESIAKAWGKKLRSNVRTQNRKAKAAMSGRVKTITTPADMVRDFDTAAKEVWAELVGTLYSKRDLDRVIKYRDQYRAKNP